MSSPREREKKDRRKSREDEREGQGRKRNMKESEEEKRGSRITKTRLFKYTENFTTKKMKIFR